MSEKAVIDPPSLSIGDEFVVMTRRGQSRKIVARILGREKNPETGVDMVWLDRRIHRSYESTMTDGVRNWSAGGAISTILSQSTQQVPEDEITPHQREALEAKSRIAERIAQRRNNIPS